MTHLRTETSRAAAIPPPPSCRRPGGAVKRRYGVFVAGYRIGRQVLVQRSSVPSTFTARCDCGAVSNVNPAEAEARLRRGAPGECRWCSDARRTRPGVCVSCDTTDQARFGKVKFRCAQCDRRHYRNGSCSCGAAFAGGGKRFPLRCPRGCAVAVSA